MPRTTAEVIKMADEFVDPRTSKRVRANAQPGVVFITPGKEVTTLPKAPNARTNKDKNKTGDGKSDSGGPVKHPDSGKLVECFHCSGNHYISDCPDISAAQKAKLDKKEVSVWQIPAGVSKPDFRHWADSVDLQLEAVHGFAYPDLVLERVKHLTSEVTATSLGQIIAKINEEHNKTSS